VFHLRNGSSRINYRCLWESGLKSIGRVEGRSTTKMGIYLLYGSQLENFHLGGENTAIIAVTRRKKID
jgi:hypothetical protein